MVSIEDRLHYQNSIDASPKLAAFNHLLLEKIFSLGASSEFLETDEAYFNIVSAIQSNNQVKFETYFGELNRRNPNAESVSPFVNDDFLIFCLLIGIIKFQKDKDWIQGILSLRSINPITTTLKNLLIEDFSSKNNLPEIVLMFLQLKLFRIF